MLWTNLVLKRRDAVLAKVNDSIFFESFMDLCNDRLSASTELFPSEDLEKAVEKSSQVLHDEAICKAARRISLLKSGTFLSLLTSSSSNSSRLSSYQGLCPGSLSSNRQFLLLRLPPRLLPLRPAGGKGRSFESFSPPSQPHV